MISCIDVTCKTFNVFNVYFVSIRSINTAFTLVSRLCQSHVFIFPLPSKFNDTAIDHEEIREFVAEPWFILLLAGVVTLMVILLAAILFVRYRQLGAKKSHLGGTLFVFPSKEKEKNLRSTKI